MKSDGDYIYSADPTNIQWTQVSASVLYCLTASCQFNSHSATGTGKRYFTCLEWQGSFSPQIKGEQIMARNGDPQGDGGEPVLPRASSSTRLRSRSDPFLVVCRCFSVITSLTAILCIAVNVLSAFRSFKNGADVFDGIFRCYAVVIAFFVVLAETEWGFIIKFWKVLEYWAGRGMLQIFVAVMTRAFPDYTVKQQDLVLLQNIASYMLLACGVVYIFSGILCIGFLKRSRQQKEITREQAVQDLEELERRREELEQLLLAERARNLTSRMVQLKDASLYSFSSSLYFPMLSSSRILRNIISCTILSDCL
ncbi:hypothetical protein PVK06_046627 [Gossypium arboreum]|uniref:Golgi apparatus membrane protein TVP15 n=1 Tax=Gossypium arboreum TaxID=29729 RepID=A0ABR0MD27_GOSAR|nr:hypothetical protein PVK06_046627 [Gossypium arboreum]